MKPFNFVALLLFAAGLVWVFTLSERTVRQIQKTYYSAISPIISKGGETEQFAKNFIKEVEHSEDLEKRLIRANHERDQHKLIADQVRILEIENNELREVSLCVIASNGGLVGRLQLPSDEVSSVLLITDEISQVSARVEGTTEVGLLAGQRTTYGNAPKLRLRYLSKNAVLSKGMKVYTDGRGKLFPADIPIGTIEDFEVGPVYIEADVIPSVNFSELQTVFVIADLSGEHE